MIKVSCPAKINLTLEVVNKRDDGFHNIKSIMQTVSLYDYLTIEAKKAETTEITLSGTSAEIPYNEKNLVFKAVKLFLEESGISAKINIFIEKNIPIAAGLAGGSTDAAGYEGIFRQMMQEFGFKYVVSTLRESYSATFNGWKALIYDGKEFYQSKRYEINPIIDRVGGGDSFSGGLIHGMLKYPGDQASALEFAVAASALKHTINGDFNLVSEAEVLSLAGGNANGRVQR